MNDARNLQVHNAVRPIEFLSPYYTPEAYSQFSPVHFDTRYPILVVKKYTPPANTKGIGRIVHIVPRGPTAELTAHQWAQDFAVKNSMIGARIALKQWLGPRRFLPPQPNQLVHFDNHLATGISNSHRMGAFMLCRWDMLEPQFQRLANLKLRSNELATPKDVKAELIVDIDRTLGIAKGRVVFVFGEPARNPEQALIQAISLNLRSVYRLYAHQYWRGDVPIPEPDSLISCNLNTNIATPPHSKLQSLAKVWDRLRGSGRKWLDGDHRRTVDQKPEIER